MIYEAVEVAGETVEYEIEGNIEGVFIQAEPAKLDGYTLTSTTRDVFESFGITV